MVFLQNTNFIENFAILFFSFLFFIEKTYFFHFNEKYTRKILTKLFQVHLYFSFFYHKIASSEIVCEWF